MKPALYLHLQCPVSTHLFKDIDHLRHYEVYEDVDLFLAAPSERKVAYFEPDTWSNVIDYDILEKIQHCDAVLLRIIEVHNKLVDSIQDWDLPNFHFFISGMLNIELEHAQVHSYQHWLNDTATPYFTVNNIVNLYSEWKFENTQLLKQDKKEYGFDCLYGKPRDHRRTAHGMLKNEAHKKRFYQTEFLPFTSVHYKVVEHNADTWHEDIEPADADDHMRPCRFHGHYMHPSQIMPQSIYRQTKHTLVLETHADNHFSFFTEKIAKPMLMGRVFVVISGQYYLRNLRELGFQTFGHILDESYDEIENESIRIKAALDAARSIADMPGPDVLKSCLSTFKHNQKQMYKLMRTFAESSPERFLEEFNPSSEQE